MNVPNLLQRASVVMLAAGGVLGYAGVLSHLLSESAGDLLYGAGAVTAFVAVPLYIISHSLQGVTR